MRNGSEAGVETGAAAAVFAALALVGAMLGAFAVHDFARARASLSWPVVEAVVLSERGGALRYAYNYDGRSYQSTRLAFFTAGPQHPKAAAPGDAIAVSLQPENPSVAVVAPGGSGAVFAAMLGGAGLLMFIGLGGAIRAVAGGGAFGREEALPQEA